MTRKIIHFDLDAFFCAVEELHNPRLRGVPFAVGGRPEGRGVVSSCSYPARRLGIHSAMPMSQALRRCPDLVILPPRHRLYADMSRRVMAILRDLTPLVEQLSIDEAFLDVTALPEPAVELARQVQRDVWESLDLPASLGVATNKLVAKIATDVGKASARSGAYPRTIQVVPPGQEAAFLAPLPVDALWGVGPRTAERLAELGVHTIGDIVRLPEAELAARFGKLGHDLARRARGMDDRPVVTDREIKSVSQESTFPQDVTDVETLRRTVAEHARGVAARLHRYGLAARTVRLKLRWTDFTIWSRQTTLAQPTQDEAEIRDAALRLLERHYPLGWPVRLIGVGAGSLGPPLRQMSFWDLPESHIPSDKLDRLTDAVETLRRRFGPNAIVRASELDDEVTR